MDFRPNPTAQPAVIASHTAPGAVFACERPRAARAVLGKGEANNPVPNLETTPPGMGDRQSDGHIGIAATLELAATVLASWVEGEEDCDGPNREDRHAAVVDGAYDVVAAALLHVAADHVHREGRNREVHEEDPAPAEHVGEESTEQRADRVPESGYAEEQPPCDAGLLGR